MCGTAFPLITAILTTLMNPQIKTIILIIENVDILVIFNV